MTEKSSSMEGITFGDFDSREVDSYSTNNSDRNIFTFMAEELNLSKNSNVNNGENSNSSQENRPQTTTATTKDVTEALKDTNQTGNSTTENTIETVSRNSNRIKSNTLIKSYFSITHSKSNSLDMTRSEGDILTPKPQRIKRTQSPSNSIEQNKQGKIDSLFSENILENSISELERDIQTSISIHESSLNSTLIESNVKSIPRTQTCLFKQIQILGNRTEDLLKFLSKKLTLLSVNYI